MNLLQFCLAVEDFNKKMMVGFFSQFDDDDDCDDEWIPGVGPP